MNNDFIDNIINRELTKRQKLRETSLEDKLRQYLAEQYAFLKVKKIEYNPRRNGFEVELMDDDQRDPISCFVPSMYLKD